MYASWMKKVIDEALKHRNTKIEEEEKGEFVVMNDKLFNELQQTNFLSSKQYYDTNIIREAWARSVPTLEEDS